MSDNSTNSTLPPAPTMRISEMNEDLPFLLFFLCTLLALFLAFAHFSSHCRTTPRGGADRGLIEFSRRKTQDFIEKMLVLKSVLFESNSTSPDDVEKSNVEPKKRFGRKKSNLVLDGDDPDAAVCPICLCEYQDGDQICWSYNKSCDHHFHAQCGIAWLAKHSECPMCRAEYLVDPEKAQGDKEQSEETTPATSEQPLPSTTEDSITATSGDSNTAIAHLQEEGDQQDPLPNV